jgi:hypothetical protein
LAALTTATSIVDVDVTAICIVITKIDDVFVGDVSEDNTIRGIIDDSDTLSALANVPADTRVIVDCVILVCIAVVGDVVDVRDGVGSGVGANVGQPVYCGKQLALTGHIEMSCAYLSVRQRLRYLTRQLPPNNNEAVRVDK